MATQTKINFVNKSAIAAQALLDLYGDLSQLNTLWAGTPDYQHGIVQADLNSVPAFADCGLTVAQLTEVEYAIGQIVGLLSSKLPDLSVLANIPALPTS